MSASPPVLLKFLLATAAAGGALAVTFAAFEGWVRHAADIFLAAAQSGQSWCL